MRINYQWIFLFLCLLIQERGSSANPVQEQWEQTIRKCLDDLDSEEVSVRRRAILLLSKYQDPKVTQALLKSLEDSSASVRLASLVGIVERDKLWSKEVVQAVLYHLKDKDIHIRRLSSAHIQKLLFPYLLKNKDILTPEIKACLLSAYRDPDPGIRKNMFDLYSYFRSFIPRKIMIDALKDEDRLIRIKALDICSRILSRNDFLKQVKSMTKDSDQLIRLHLLKLIQYKIPATMARPILDDLIHDQDFSVSTAARVLLFLHGNVQQAEELLKRLDNPRMDSKMAARFIYRLVSVLGRKKAKEELQNLMAHSNARYRALALQNYLLFFPDKESMDILVRFFADPSQHVRRTATQIWLRKKQYTSEQIEKVIMSSYMDVRRVGLTLANILARDYAKAVLMDLILDESNKIRLQALEIMMKRRINGWKTVIRQSLESPDPVVRSYLLKLIFATMPEEEGIKFLKDIQSLTQDKELKDFILKNLLDRSTELKHNSQER